MLSVVSLPLFLNNSWFIRILLLLCDTILVKRNRNVLKQFTYQIWHLQTNSILRLILPLEPNL